MIKALKIIGKILYEIMKLSVIFGLTYYVIYDDFVKAVYFLAIMIILDIGEFKTKIKKELNFIKATQLKMIEILTIALEKPVKKTTKKKADNKK